MPDGISPYAAYPFMLHERYRLPWGIQIFHNRMTLHSVHCTKILLTNDELEGILDRIKIGVHANCALVYQPMGELVRQKSQKIDTMWFSKLTISRNFDSGEGSR